MTLFHALKRVKNRTRNQAAQNWLIDRLDCNNKQHNLRGQETKKTYRIMSQVSVAVIAVVPESERSGLDKNGRGGQKRKSRTSGNVEASVIWLPRHGYWWRSEAFRSKAKPSRSVESRRRTGKETGRKQRRGKREEDRALRLFQFLPMLREKGPPNTSLNRLGSGSG